MNKVQQVTTRVYKNALQASEALQPYFKESKGISRTSLHRGVLTRFAVEEFFSYELLNSRKQRILYNELRTRATFTCPKPRIPCFGSRVLGFRSDPSWWMYWLLRDLLYEEAMCKGSTGNRLLYAVKAVP